MSKSTNAFNQILEESRNIPWLRPVWSMLYNEGIRGNHILFSPSDLDQFNEDQDMQNNHYLSKNSDDPLLQEILFQLICCPDFRSMMDLIKSQSYEIKKLTFAFYLRTLDHWKFHRAQSLN